MQGIFLVGGKGTRLGELTKNTPKPLLKVQDKPFIEWVIAKAKAQGITDILLLAGYQAEEVVNFGYPCIVEHEPLGTGGALRNAAKHLKEEFFLFNGDTICDFDYMELKREIKDAGCASAVIKGKNDLWMGAGVYFMKRRFIGHVPRGASSLENDVMPKALSIWDIIYHQVDAKFIDIGTPESYKKAQEEKWISQI